VSFGLGEEDYDRIGMAHSLNGLGGMAVRRGDLEEATRLFEKALTLRREVGDREGIANVLSNLGVIQDRRGRYEDALRFYRRAAEAHRAIGSRRGLATVLNNIGVVNLTRGDVNIAIEHFEGALRIRREIGDRARIGSALTNLAEARALAGEIEVADSFYREAADLLRTAGDPSGEASALAGRARLLRRVGDLREAEELLAAAVARDGRDPVVRAALHLEAAEQHFVRGEPEAASAAAERGYALAKEIGDLEAQAQSFRLRAGDGGDQPARALERLERAEKLLAGTSGPELARVLLEQGILLAESEPGRSREVLMRARGLLDAMEARGAVLPERECVERLLSAGAGTD
jgi:tetratricopeptide (TPR) repeat protein